MSPLGSQVFGKGPTDKCVFICLSSKTSSLIPEHNTIKQGSSENDGRSNFYDRSEFNIISN